ncbi:hypothetical protein CLAFUW4_11807 [Fulvia fulva]|uniref:Uncharacterized protein n=1 Tax=Passalora fulva TaxID=5499 RepID=A0A9Q8PES2_PASFU|nr:uncharacterized protein CLAFUR5_10849 [Fulvia fulva]KAK4617917.1 hypothetical protein CLAFUR4_11812 [Fulvia fulva]KAK4618752.1 hypothetical protein CLAFUR0_11825 [Fulvia fulva]UJO21082.1 hypothetical protein CLAFUR5_10849 [Fulvia fulva]WPV18698.1 hypothetical protein CLAFUW4_11807 [Fulvia fulva]WPV33534.1 hypothetical protein CLAFUW7_11814 [Fulvia fulva]
MKAISSEDLNHLLGTLPQELYDEIYTLTFTPSSHTHAFSTSWQPPHLLHVDRASRALFAEKYFGTASTFTSRTSAVIHFVTLAKWLSRLDPKHLELISSIMVTDVRPQGSQSWSQINPSIY